MDGIVIRLDNTEVDSPEELNDFTQEFIRDEENRILRYDYPSALTFAGDGYAVLENKYLENFDNEVQIEITDFRSGQAEIVAKGVIKMSNCTWNIHRKTCAVEVDDFVFQRKIFARKSSPMVITADETLDGGPMDSLEPIDITMFLSSNGDDIPEPRKCYDIIEVMAKMIEFLTNGEVGFSSPWYDSLPDDERMCIITGANLRDPDVSARAPEITFQNLFDELWKKDNLMLIVRDVNGQGSLELVRRQDTFVQSSRVVINNVMDLERSLDFEQLFSRVKFGTTSSTQDFGLAEPLPYIPFLTFFEETYNIPSAIGVDKELNLSGRWQTDTNNITKALAGDDDFDSEIFIIQYDRSTNAAVKGEYYAGPNPNVRLYNERLLNVNIAGRYDYLSDVVLSAGLLGSSFSAGQGFSNPIQVSGSAPAGVATVIYDDTNNPRPYPDTNPPGFNEGAYNDQTYIYTAPAAGFYRFRTRFFWRQQQLPRLQFRLFRIRLITGPGFVENQAGTIQGTLYNDSGQIQLSGPRILITDTSLPWLAPTGYRFDDIPLLWTWELLSEQTIFMEEGDEVYVSISVQQYNTPDTTGSPAPYNILMANGRWQTVTTPLSGGTYEPGDPDRFFLGRYTAEHVDIAPEYADIIMQNPTDSIVLNTGNNDPRVCYPQKIIRNLVTGKVDIETLFNRQQAVL